MGIVCCAQSTKVSALYTQDPCAKIDSVFARGSGDSGKVQHDNETTEFKNTLDREANSLMFTQHFYGLGDESYNNFQYPHVGIWGDASSAANGFGATVSSGEHFTYGESVDAGVGELTSYLRQRMSNCPDSKYIVGGYSQGAQVVVSTLPLLSESERDKITYVALFGNPKLLLPEAHSFEAYRKDPSATGDPLPDSCYGVGLSPWHNVIEDCLTFSGKLYSEKAYDPYPADIQTRVHEWCFDEDGICDSKKESWGAGHTKYAGIEGVPRAVAEALSASGIAAGAAFIDLTDISKRYDFLFEIPMQCSPLFTYPEPIPSLAVPYAIHDMGGINKQIYAVGENVYDLDYGPYEYDMKQYIASLWRENSEHIRYRISPLNCGSQFMIQQSARSSLSIDAASEQPVSTSLAMRSFSDPIADYNNTPIISEIPDDPACLESTNCRIIDATTTVLTQPTPIYPAIKNITNVINRTVLYPLATSPSTTMYDTFQWDINADGETDIITAAPSLSYAYPYPYEGRLSVTALSSTNGLSASTEFNVKILSSYRAPALPLAPLKLTIKKLPNDSVLVSWTKDPEDNVTAEWRLKVDDFPIAKTTLPTTSITVTDMHLNRGEPRTITIAGLTSSGLEGSQSSVTIPANLPENETVETDGVSSPLELTATSKESAERFDLNKPVAQYDSPLSQTSQNKPSLFDVTKKFYPNDTHAQNNRDDSTQTPWVTIIATAIVLTSLLATIKLRK